MFSLITGGSDGGWHEQHTEPAEGWQEAQGWTTVSVLTSSVSLKYWPAYLWVEGLRGAVCSLQVLAQMHDEQIKLKADSP